MTNEPKAQPVTWIAPQRPVEGGTVYVRPEGGWVKSSLCHQGGCIEVFRGPSGVTAIRNSREPEKRVLVDPEEWVAFLKGVKAGEFD